MKHSYAIIVYLMPMNTEEIIAQTKCWLKSVVIDCHFCPFAKRELERDSIRYAVSDAVKLESCLEKLIDECVFLDSSNDTETTLIVFPVAFADFDDFLTGIDLAEELLVQQDYEGVYQLASFHPDYCFSGSDNDDAANYTNRSPYPMLHLLRESSLEKALAGYDAPENIPQRNIEYARKKGIDVMQAKLDRCRHE